MIAAFSLMAATLLGFATPAAAATEDISPSRTIAGPSTGFTDGGFGPVFVTTLADGQLVVTDNQAHSVSIFAADADGDEAPVRTIAGPATGLFRPYGVAVLPDGKIAVAHATLVEGGGEIAVFAADANGDVVPLRTINGPSTQLNVPFGLAALSDGSLAATNAQTDENPAGGSAVYVFAPDASGNTAPARTISGSNTLLAGGAGLAALSDDSLVVANSGGESVLVFAPGVTGDVAPVRSISGGSTQFSTPLGVAALDDGGIAVANLLGDSVGVFGAGADGDLAPSRAISGANTTLTGPSGVAQLPGGDLAVVNYFASSITVYGSGGPAPEPTTPAAPTNLVATPGNASASIAFTPGDDGGSPITGYQYRVKDPSVVPGTADATFNTNVGETLKTDVTPNNAQVYAVAAQPDGKTVVGGWFAEPSGSLARFNFDGTPDEAFNNNVSTVLTAKSGQVSVRALAVQSDGKIVVGGRFDSLSTSLARFNADGTPDKAFNDTVGKALNSDVYALAVQADGKILVGGDRFTSISATAVMVRFNADGTLDTAFNDKVKTRVFSGSRVSGIALQPDGQIVVAGRFTTPGRGVARFAADGTPDAAFNSNVGVTPVAFSIQANAVALQSNGTIVVGGRSTLGASFNLLRLGTDGKYLGASTINEDVWAVAVEADDKILAGGTFTTPRSSLARFQANGRADTAFNTALGTTAVGAVFGIAGLPSKIMVGGSFKSPSQALARIDAGGFGPWLTGGASGSPLSIPGLTNGKTYDVEVRAVNAVGAGATSAPVSVTPEANAPSALVATPGDGSATIAFTPGGPPATNYEYTLNPGDASPSWVPLDPADDTSPVTIPGLTNGTQYDIALRGVDGAVTSDPSEVVSVTPGVPLAPTDVVASPGDGEVTVTFTPGGDNGSAVSNYDYTVDGGATWVASDPAVTGSPVTIGGLINGTEYSVGVRGVNANGSGVPSAIVKVTPAGPTQLFDEPFTGATLNNPAAVFLPTVPGGKTNVACLTASGNLTAPPPPGCAKPALDKPGEGVLRLTPATSNSVGSVFAAAPSPSGGVLDVRFDSYQWGGSFAGDGIGFVLAAVDPATQTPPGTTGFPGGSLGYAVDKENSAPGLANGYLGIGLDRFGNFSRSDQSGLGCVEPAWGGSRAPNQVVVRGPGNGQDGYCLLNSSANSANSLTTPVLQGADRAASKVPVRVTINPTGEAVTLPGTSDVVPARSYRVQFTGIGQVAQSFVGELPDASAFYDSAWLDANGVPKQLAFGWLGSTGGAVNNHEVSQAGTVSLVPVAVLSTEVEFQQEVGQPEGTGTYVVTPTVTGTTLDDVLTVRSTVGAKLTPQSITAGDGWDCKLTGQEFTCTRPGPIPPNTVLPPIEVVVQPVGTVTAADISSQFPVRSLSPEAQGNVNVVPPAVAPEAPADLTATPGNGEATIAFTPGSDGGLPITNYEYSLDGGESWTELDPADTTSPVTIPGLTDGTKYDIALRAVNEAGGGTASTPVTVTPGVPLAPTNLVAAPGNRSASIAFTPGNNNGAPITNYKYSLDGGATWKAVVPPTAGSPVAIAGLTNGTEYSILLQGVNANGDGVPSAPVKVTPSTVPTAPTALAAEPADGALTISFTQGGDGGSAITNYQYSVDGGKWTALDPADASSPVTVPGLTNGTEYTVALRAVNANGASLTSATVTATPSTTPDAPTGLTAERGNGEATLKFTAPASDGGAPVTNYEYALDGGTWVPFDPAVTGSPAVVKGLTNGTSYDISLRAVNDRGVSPSAGPVTVTPATVPGAVEVFIAGPLDRGVSVFVEGLADDGGSPITNYEYSIDGGATWVPFDPPVTDVGFGREIKGLINGTTARVAVRALNDVGAGPATTVAEVVVGSPTAPPGKAYPRDGSVIIEFDQPLDNGAPVEGFEYSLDGGKTWVRPDPDVTESPIIVEGLTNGTTVDVQLRAFNDRGAGPAGEYGEMIVGSPSAPVIRNVIPGVGELTLEFTPAFGNGADVTNYQYSLDMGVTWVPFDPAVTTSPVTIAGLTDGQKYDIRLRGINDRGPGEVGFAEGTPGTPTAPTDLVATAGDRQVEITFTPGNDNGSPVTNYLYSIDGGFTFQEFNPAQTTSPVTITGLTNGESYSVVLAPINARGEGQPSATVFVEPASVPGAVELFRAGPVDGGVELFVVGPEDTGGLPIINYEYSLDGGKTWTAFDPAETDAEFGAVIPGLTNGQTYEVAVRAVNDLGGGTESEVIEVVAGAPTAPPGFVVPGDRELIIEFEPDAVGDNGDPVTNFEYSLDGGKTWITVAPPTTESPIVVTGLTNGTTYDVALRAVNGRGPGGVAEYGEVIVGSPAAPIVETVVPGSGQLTLQFVPAPDNGDPVTNYQYRLTTVSDPFPGPWVDFAPAVTGSPATITGLTDGVGYLIELRGVNGRGPGASDIAAGTPGSPTAPTNLVATPGDGSATIAFTPGSDNGSPITNFTALVVPDSGPPFFVTFDPAQATSPVTIDGLTNGTGYTIFLIPINARGEGQMSTSVFVTPAGPPLAPTDVVANAGPGSVALSFTDADDNGSPITGYEYTVDGGATWVAFVPPVTGSPAIITDLPSGEALEVSIRAVNGVGPGAASTPVSVTPVGTPGQVDLFRAGPRDGGVEVFVVAPSNTGGLPITNYEYSLDGGKTWTAFDPAETDAEFGAVIPGLINGQTYEVAVRAVNDLGGGTESEVIEVVAGAPTAPPGSVVPGDGQLIIEFEPDEVVDNGDPVTNFEYSLDGGTTWITPAPPTTESPIVVTGLTNGTTYDVALRAVNGRGPGGVAEYGEVIVGSPAAPIIETVVPGSGQLTLQFVPAPDNGDPVTNYQYRLTTEDDPFPGPWVDFDPPVTGSPVTITGLTDGVGYVIELRGVNSRGPGVSDAAVGVPGSPTAPTDLVATPGDGSATIAFTPGSDNGSPITNYSYLVVPENGPPFYGTFDPAQATSPVTIDGLTNGTGYTIFLIPVNARGEGQMSTSVFITPRTTPGAPTGLSVEPGFSSATVSFTAPGDDGGAEITNYQYSLDGGASWTALDPAQASSPVTITGLPNGVTSTIRLRAVNEAGAGAVSEEVSVTPLGSVFIPVTPYRAYDSRDGDGRLSSDAPRMVDTKVPEGAVAVAYNLTAVGMTGVGFLAVAPGGAPEGGTSTLNYTAPGQQWANAFTSGVDAEGRVQVSVGGAPTQFVVDVVGYYAPQTATNGVKGAAMAPEVEGSLFVPMTPQRAYDSRDTGAGGPLGNGAPRRVNVTAGGLVPAEATAVAYTLTQTGTTGRGIFTVAPAGEERPAVSNINWFQTNQTSANSSVVSITKGSVDVWASSPDGGSAQFVIDILGYYLPADEAPWAAAFTPIDPQRAYDSRKDTPSGPIMGGGKPFTTSMAVPGVPEQSVAVAFNLTATGGTGTGYLTTTPGDVKSPPVASTINWWQPRQTLANGTVVDVPSLRRMTEAGALNGGPKLPVNTFAGGGTTQYVIDVAGYFTANPDR